MGGPASYYPFSTENKCNGQIIIKKITTVKKMMIEFLFFALYNERMKTMGLRYFCWDR